MIYQNHLNQLYNGVKDIDFINGQNAELNQKIISQFTIKDNKNKLLIFTFLMPYLLYSDINSNNNTLFNAFVLQIK